LDGGLRGLGQQQQMGHGFRPPQTRRGPDERAFIEASLRRPRYFIWRKHGSTGRGGVSMTGVMVLGTALVVAAVSALAMRWKNGRFARVEDAAQRLGPEDLRAPLGDRAPLVQCSSAFCAACRATRQVLRQVGDLVPGV